MSSEKPSGGEGLDVRNRYDEGESPEFLQAKERVVKKGEKVLTGRFSEIDDKDKYSEGYRNCVGVVAIGFDVALGKNISFLCHLTSGQVAEYKHDKKVMEGYREDLAILSHKLQEMKERCEPGSLAIGILGGNMYDEDGQEHYDKALNNIGEVIYSTTRLDAYVLHSPARAKSHSMPYSWSSAYVDTESRQVLLEGTDAMAHIGINGKFLLSQAEMQKRFSEIHLKSAEKGVYGYSNTNKSNGGYIDAPSAEALVFFKTHRKKPVITNRMQKTTVDPMNRSDPQRRYYEHLKDTHGFPVSHVHFIFSRNYEIWKRVSHPKSAQNRSTSRRVSGKAEVAKRKWIRGTKWDDGYYHPSSADKY